MQAFTFYFSICDLRSPCNLKIVDQISCQFWSFHLPLFTHTQTHTHTHAEVKFRLATATQTDDYVYNMWYSVTPPHIRFYLS